MLSPHPKWNGANKVKYFIPFYFSKRPSFSYFHRKTLSERKRILNTLDGKKLNSFGGLPSQEWALWALRHCYHFYFLQSTKQHENPLHFQILCWELGICVHQGDVCQMHLRNAYICKKIIKWKELKIETGRITNRKYVKKPYQLLTPPPKKWYSRLVYIYTSTFCNQQFWFV